MLMIVMMVMVVIMLMVMVMSLFHLILQIQHVVFHDFQYLFPSKLCRRCGHDMSLIIQSAQGLHRFIHLILRRNVRSAENDGAGILYLILIEFSEISQIHLAFIHISHCDMTVQKQVAFFLYPFHSLHHIGKHTDAGGLDDDTIRMVGVNHFL